MHGTLGLQFQKYDCLNKSTNKKFSHQRQYILDIPEIQSVNAGNIYENFEHSKKE